MLTTQISQMKSVGASVKTLRCSWVSIVENTNASSKEKQCLSAAFVRVPLFVRALVAQRFTSRRKNFLVLLLSLQNPAFHTLWVTTRWAARPSFQRISWVPRMEACRNSRWEWVPVRMFSSTPRSVHESRKNAFTSGIASRRCATRTASLRNGRCWHMSVYARSLTAVESIKTSSSRLSWPTFILKERFYGTKTCLVSVTSSSSILRGCRNRCVSSSGRTRVRARVWTEYFGLTTWPRHGLEYPKGNVFQCWPCSGIWDYVSPCRKPKTLFPFSCLLVVQTRTCGPHNRRKTIGR